jgi:2-alkenal reductase
LVSLYERVNPGVVAIRVLTQQGGGLGSGFVFDAAGYVVTNYHVVENETDLEVDFSSGFKTRGEVIGIDIDSDLAIVKVSAPAEELHPLPLGDSALIKVGQTVVAIGNPFGLNGTMTTGVISALGRTLESMRAAPGGGQFTAGDIIQTDTAINPGNSGGPLLNLKGEVIGVNRAIRTFNFTNDEMPEPLNSGVGFAIAINIVKRVAPALIAEGHYDYPYLGITSLDDISLLEQEALDLPRSTGAYVTGVTSDGPADKAGLRGGSASTDFAGLYAGGDLIIAIDGQPVRQFGDLLSYLINYKSPGDLVALTVLREGREIRVELTLGKRP